MSTRYQLHVIVDNSFIRQKIIENMGSDQTLNADDDTISHGADSGVDMFFNDSLKIMPGETKLVSLGVKCKMVNLTTNSQVGYYLYPRSSIGKTPLRLANSVGIIDAGYRGDMLACLTNTSPMLADYIKDFSSGEDVMNKYVYNVVRGERLVQICAPDLSPFSVKFVKNLNDTLRGAGGFGSTGI